ncbi:3-deoxy-D-manno-octulosonic acid kinase [Methylonatrum kenyense]|uniref:3-deoxy-D-manno-octulosonic acid kinase n=1 Tax=Methylonatrum kenyense TaxID=455253 RepID=UPI0020BF8D1A|nr:3-deoxy-D-manno-octulosonic acid kinase [Methylonatrum kenyense]MCK8516949.1 3-deoxy-D-manno-octulosonic acid kinase [Methylonatrum kenyense]
MQAAEFRDGRYRYIYDQSLPAPPADWLFEPATLAQNDLVLEQGGGRGTVIFISDPYQSGRQWALRHYMRGGSVARMFGDRYLWSGLHDTRAWREWHYTSQLFDAGLPVARPVAGRVVREGPLYRADFITVRVPGAASFDDLLSAGEVPLETWSAIGRTIRRFHDAGAWHSDLNSRNILVGPDPETVHIIDWDRGEWRTGNGKEWRDANLDRLKRDLEKRLRIKDVWAYTPQGHQALLDGYKS